jgi:hypothetical protein
MVHDRTKLQAKPGINRSVAGNNTSSGISLPAVAHSQMIKASDPGQGKSVIQQQKEDKEIAQFVLQRQEIDEKLSLEEKMPFQLQTNNSHPVIQRVLNVNFTSNAMDNTFSLSASGRPGNWAARVTKKLKPKEGESRGHIIEWSIMLRAYVNEINGLKKEELLKRLKLGKNAPDRMIESKIVDELKNIYSDLDNLTINDTGADNAAGGSANQLTQQIEAEEDDDAKEILLKQLFDHSFNPGKDDKGLDQFEKYIMIFAQAWNLPPEKVATWPNKWMKRSVEVNEKREIAREKEEVNIPGVIRSVEVDEKKAPPRKKEVVNVPGILIDIKNGINEIRRKDLILEQLAAKSSLKSTEAFNKLKNEFSLEIDEIMRKITFLHEGGYIEPIFTVGMLKAVIGVLSSSS